MAGDDCKKRKKVYGEGTIFQRSSDGMWVGAAYVYTSSGRLERRRVYSKSFDEVRAKLLRLQSNNADGIPVPEKSMTVAEYMDHWLAIVKAEKRLTTYHGDESVVRLHIVPALGRKRLDRLTGADVRHFISTVRLKCCAARTARTPPPARSGTMLHRRRPLLRAPADAATGAERPRRAVQRVVERRARGVGDAQRRQARQGLDAALQGRQGAAGQPGQGAAQAGRGDTLVRPVRHCGHARAAPRRASGSALGGRRL